MRQLSLDEANAEKLFGTRDENLRFLEERLGVSVNARGGAIGLSGRDERSEIVAARVLEAFDRLLSSGATVGREEFRTGVRVLDEDPEVDLVEFFLDASIPATLKRLVAPRNLNQRLFIREVGAHDLVFAIGPAGTGKTYLAVAMAAAALLDKQVKRLVLCRPAVEAGERLGFLPGDLIEKVNPYLRPVYDALYDILGYDKTAKLLERQVIEIAPLAFMRGRTLNDAFIILDEAQNTTREQMKMFLTRMGFHSKAVITGDITQIDLPGRQRSGLVEALEILGGAEGIAFISFTHRDVVRHRLVQEVVDRYARWEASRAERGEEPT
ncbi:MAG: PhoH family protein [Thermoanaerobaculales bacterium]|jgi:phosphate starvation-inducible PhoH-like protein|nr:PhoH family protein [Thermoanaerobaculales bacterium]